MGLRVEKGFETLSKFCLLLLLGQDEKPCWASEFDLDDVGLGKMSSRAASSFKGLLSDGGWKNPVARAATHVALRSHMTSTLLWWQSFTEATHILTSNPRPPHITYLLLRLNFNKVSYRSNWLLFEVHELGKPPFYKIAWKLPPWALAEQWVLMGMRRKNVGKKTDYLTLGYFRLLFKIKISRGGILICWLRWTAIYPLSRKIWSVWRSICFLKISVWARGIEHGRLHFGLVWSVVAQCGGLVQNNGLLSFLFNTVLL